MNAVHAALAIGLALDSGSVAVAQETTRVSVDSSGAQGNDGSYESSISADGSLVAFISWVDTFVAGDTNGTSDIFVHDRGTGVTDRMSVNSSGAQGNGGC
jgi:hypothetical protein